MDEIGLRKLEKGEKRRKERRTIKKGQIGDYDVDLVCRAEKPNYMF